MYFNVQALVLRASKTGENDRRLSLYTREQGRLFALAAGAGRPSSRLGPALEPAVEARFRLWGKPDGVSSRVTGGTIVSAFSGFRRHWSRMASAQFLCEWMEKLTPLSAPHPEKYDLLQKALVALENDADALSQGFLRSAFMIQFLILAGYALGEEMAGTLYRACPETLEALSRHDFEGALPGGPASLAAPLEEQLLRFVSPLVNAPFKARSHKEALIDFQRAAFDPDRRERPRAVSL